MNKRLIGSITAGVLLATTTIALARPYNADLGYYSQGRVVLQSAPSSPFIYVSPNSNFSSWNQPYAGGVYQSWYQNKEWAPGYLIVNGNVAKWRPGGWVYRD